MVRKFSKSRLVRFAARNKRASRHLHFEQCESRQMLDGKADIVFLVDESNSGSNESSQEWLSQLVAGVDIKETEGDTHLSRNASKCV